MAAALIDTTTPPNNVYSNESFFAINTDYSQDGSPGDQTLPAPDQKPEWAASMYLSTIGIPIVIIIGILGNMLSLVVFLCSRMRSQTCSIYLAHLNIADTGFLLCLVPTWLGWLGIDIFNRNGWCQITVYATFVFAFLSIWTVVAFTVERYIVVYHPLKKHSMCTKKRAFSVLIFLDISALILYCCSLFMTGLTIDRGLFSCTPLPKYHGAFKVISMIDTVVTMIVPSVSIIVLNCAIMAKIYLFSKQMNRSLSEKDLPRQSRYSEEDDDENHYLAAGGSGAGSGAAHHSRSDDSSNSCNSSKNNKERLTTISKRLQESSTRRRRVYRMKTTRSLVLVSSSFLLLNMPSHAFRLYLFFSRIYERAAHFSGNIVILHEVAMFIYYINFACNVFLYVLFSQSFRYGFLSVLKAARHRIRQQSCPTCFENCRKKLRSIHSNCVHMCFFAPVTNLDMQTMDEKVSGTHNQCGDKQEKLLSSRTNEQLKLHNTLS